MSSPFRLISDAHAAVETGDDVTLHVAGGTYVDNVGDGADEYHTFTRYTFLGGYAPGFGSRDPAAYETTVQAGDTSAPVFNFDNAESVTIDGFTITNGRSGVVIAGWASGRTAIVRSCRIVDNGHFTGDHQDSSLVNGAGVRLSGRDVLLSDSVIEDNDAGKYGGGAYIGDSEESGAYAIVERNIVRNNQAHTLSAHGGGIWLSMSGVVRGNLIEGNAIDVPSGGGAGG
jgi:hypothetical protein